MTMDEKQTRHFQQSWEKLALLKHKTEEKIIKNFHELKTLLRAAKETKQRLDQLKIEFINDVNQTNKQIGEDVGKTADIKKRFVEIYKKLTEVNALFSEVNADVHFMEDELNHILKKEAVLSAHTNIMEQIAKTDEIKQQYEEVKQKKLEFEEYLDKVNAIVESMISN
jgi:hypothetical protein